jgi:formate dehydrogenase subunit gamma
MNKIMMKRHTKPAIFIHWFNAACWILLLVTGLGLIKNPALTPIGMWWPTTLQNVLGGGVLLYLHIAIGVLWTLGYLVFLLMNPGQHFVHYIKEILTISWARDLGWLFKKMVLLTLGEKVLKKIGMDSKLPDQGFYNFGQKLFAIPATFGGVVIVVTGVIMAMSRFTAVHTGLVQWSILIHFVTVGLVFAGLLIHIYMAALLKEERPAFFSMFSGMIPESFARHHNKLWYLKQTTLKN